MHRQYKGVHAPLSRQSLGRLCAVGDVEQHQPRDVVWILGRLSAAAARGERAYEE